jgi:hypothetical protein
MWTWQHGIMKWIWDNLVNQVDLTNSLSTLQFNLNTNNTKYLSPSIPKLTGNFFGMRHLGLLFENLHNMQLLETRLHISHRLWRKLIQLFFCCANLAIHVFNFVNLIGNIIGVMIQNFGNQSLWSHSYLTI